MRFTFVIVFMFLLTFVYAASDSDVIFAINGCNFDEQGADVYVDHNRCSDSLNYPDVHRGLFYCGTEDSGNSWKTTEKGLGCTRGANALPNKPDPSNICCPQGYTCNLDDSEFKCEPGAYVCTADMSEDDCHDKVQKYYYDTGDASTSYCACGGFECGDYINEQDCTDDKLNVSVGREYEDFYEFLCGGNYYAFLSAKCSWDDVDSSCSRNVVNRLQNGDAADRWNCSSGFKTEECIDGIQKVNWTITRNFDNSLFMQKLETDDPLEFKRCMKNAGCIAGMNNRACGEALVKLPGFSLFSLFVSVGILAFCYSRKEFGLRVC